MLPPKTSADAFELIRSQERYHADLWRVYDENEKYYEGEFDGLVDLPEGYELTKPTTLRAVVDEAIDNIMPADIQVKYSPRSDTKKGQEDADTIRMHLKGLWRHWRRLGADIDPWRDAGKNLFINGVGAIKEVPDFTLWPTLPEGEIVKLKESGGKAIADRLKTIRDIRSTSAPIMCRSLHPKCIIVDPSVGRKLWMIERYQASSDEVTSMYAQWDKDFVDPRRNRKHKIHEMWTATYATDKGEIVSGRHYIFIDEEFKHEGENPYGFLPYITKYSGFGRETYEGRPKYKSVGLFTPQVKSMALAEARRFSQFDAIMSQLAFPIGMLPLEVDAESFDTSPGALNFVPEEVFKNGDKIWVQAKIPGAEYMQSLGAISGQIERGTTQPTLRGAPVPGTDSAAQLGMYTSQSKLRLDSCQQALEDMVSEAMSRYLWFIDNVLKDNVSILTGDTDMQRAKIGPDQIRGRYDVIVKFMPNEELIKQQKLAIANDAIVKGGMSPYDAYEYAGFDNPLALIARRMAWDVMNEPQMRRGMGKEMLKEWGIDADMVELEEQIDQAKLQLALSQILQAMGTGAARGVGDPMSATGVPPPSNQDPLAALAQAGQGPMTMAPGAPVQNQALMPAPQMQAMGG